MTDSTDPWARIRLVTQNGELVPYSDAKISVMAPGFTFAAAVFEGIRGYWHDDQAELNLFRLEAHLQRLQFSMKLMELDEPPSSAEFSQQILDNIRANDYREDVYVRIQAYVDEWGSMTATGPIGSSIIVRPRPRAPAFEDGTAFHVSSWRRNDDNASPPRVKAAANYFNNRLAGLEAKRKGAGGALILTAEGKLSEGPGGCVFLVRDGRLITPDITSGILESITRDTVLELASELGVACAERVVDRTELYLAEEAFYCGTGQELVPIIRIDEWPVGDGRAGALTRALQAAYDGVVRGATAAHGEWRTPVYG